MSMNAPPLSYDVILLYRFFLNGYERTRFWCHKWSVVRVCVIFLMLLDIALNVASGFSTVRWARPLRPLMIIGRTRNVRQVFLGCLLTLCVGGRGGALSAGSAHVHGAMPPSKVDTSSFPGPFQRRRNVVQCLVAVVDGCTRCGLLCASSGGASCPCFC